MSNRSIFSFNESELTKYKMEIQQGKKQSHIDKPFDGLDTIVTLHSGKTMPLAQYRHEIQESCIQSQLQKQQGLAVPIQSSQINQPGQQPSEATTNQFSQIYQPETKTIKIAVYYPDGLKHLVKFSPPVEACVSVATVKSVLKRIGVPGTGRSLKIKCMACPVKCYDYLADVENIQPQQSEFVLNVQKTSNDCLKTQPTKKRREFLAICPDCGVCSDDHARCIRCRAVFDENVLYIPSAN